MTLILSLIVVSIIIGLLLLLMLVDRGRRNAVLRQAADQLGLKFRPYASLSQPVRQAGFHLINCGQFRHFRYLLEGQYQNKAVNIFDYSLVNQQGTATQTVLLMHCPVPDNKDWHMQLWHNHWLKADPLTDKNLVDLPILQPHQKAKALRQWHIASQPIARMQPCMDALQAWCLAHPHLHIELANGMLMLYRPQFELDAEQLQQALNDALQLCTILQEPNK